jgi:acyl-CoA reductase-like NAD-dependent aldehyde dehydrogenase
MAMSTDTAAPTNPPKADVPHEVVVTCPATGKVVGRVPVSTSVEVEAVAARLRAAQPAWQRIGVEGRSRWLGKWRDWLLDHSDELLTLLQLETGKSWGDAKHRNRRCADH